MSDRKKPGWMFWLVVVLALPLLYVASFGPACWAVKRHWLRISTATAIYRPLLIDDEDVPHQRALHWYASKCNGVVGEMWMRFSVRLESMEPISFLDSEDYCMP